MHNCALTCLLTAAAATTTEHYHCTGRESKGVGENSNSYGNEMEVLLVKQLVTELAVDLKRYRRPCSVGVITPVSCALHL